ncbi:unnamed protein product [Orchesella dallaii]|uniref:EB domain-containing protein n=1 Tax=Orchesella dallaii TaxID=48710 RepID=A0ABP1PU76_9HEXA
MNFFHILVFLLSLLTLGLCNNNSIFGDMLIGGPCDFEIECVGIPGTSSECRDGYCACKAGYLPAFLLGDCLQIMNQIGAPCSENPQCQQGLPGQLSECIGGICSCVDGAVNEPTQHICYEEKEEIGQECVVNAQCRENMGDLALCTNNVCDCDPNLSVIKSDNKFCLPIIHTIEDEECLESSQCVAGIPGTLSECTDEKTCNCLSTATHEDGQHKCYLKADFVGANCEVDKQCTENLSDLSKCVDGMCICPLDTSVPSGGREKCLKIIDEINEEECEEDIQCTTGIPGPLSECAYEHPSTGKKHCDCKSDSINEPGKHECYLKAEEVGDDCEVLIQCMLLGELSRCTGNICVCPTATSVPSEDNLRCLVIVDDIGGTCTEDGQCNAGTPGDYGDYSECSDGTCQCKEDAVHEENENICYPKADEVGGRCQVDAQCRINLGELSECILPDGECSCISGISVPSRDNSRCLPIINEIGEGCEEIQQCSGGVPGPHSECVFKEDGSELVCKCNYYSIQLQNVCLLKATLVGDSCNVTQQCTENLSDLSLCSEPDENGERKCICKPGAVGNVGQTQCVYGGIPIGSPCEDDFQCMGTPGTAECSTGICGCKPGFIASIDLTECLPERNQIGQDCEQSQQCQGALGPLSECVSVSPTRKVCNCTADAVSEPGQNSCKLKATFVGDPCEVQSQCLVNLGHSQCLNGSCICLGNATASTDNKQCLLKSYLNLPCQDENQCGWMSEGASCVPVDVNDPSGRNVCRCDSDYRNPAGVNDACYLLAPFLGRSCAEHPIQCDNLDNSICLLEEKVCGCDNTTRVPGGNSRSCLLRVENLNLTCSESAQCIPPNSQCVRDAEQNEMLCKCRTNDYIESLLNPGNCLQIVKENRFPCEEEIQCTSGLGPLSSCLAGLCVCRPGYAYFNGHCYFPGSLGGPCSSDGECQAGVNNLTVCSNFECSCIPNAFPYEDTCYIEKHVGDSCNTIAECTVSIIGFVNCDLLTKTCKCLPGYSAVPGGRVCSDAHSNFLNLGVLVAYIILVSLHNFIYQ